jgi:hypothetical protein
LKDEIINNIPTLREDELNRLKSELNRETDQNDIVKFYEFIRLLDVKRNVKIDNYLKEWEKYFN